MVKKPSLSRIELLKQRVMNGRYNSCFDNSVVHWCFIIIICSVPFFKWRALPGPSFMRVDWLAMGALILLVAPCIMSNKSSLSRLDSGIWGPYLLFLFINLVSFLISPFPDNASSGLITLIQGFVLVIMTIMVVSPLVLEGELFWAIVWSTGIGALLACLGYFGGMEQFQQEGSNRGVGATLSSNNMAIMCIFAYPLVVFAMIYAKTRIGKLLGFVFTLFIIGGVIGTISRAGFLVMLLTSVLLVNQFRSKFQVRYFGLVIAAFSVVTVTAVLFLPDDFVERQLTLVNDAPAQDRSLDRRSAYVSVALDAFQKNPILGSGPDTFKAQWLNSVETRFFDMTERPAHNTYLEVLVANGSIGFLIFLFLLWKMYKNFDSAEKNLRQHGLERESHLASAFKYSFIGVCLYFFFKSGLEHKYFLLLIGLAGVIKYYELFKIEQKELEERGELPHTSG